MKVNELGGILILGLFLLALSVIFSKSFPSNEKFHQEVTYSKQIRIKLPCSSYDVCYQELRKVYSDEEIEKLDLKCSNGVCTMLGYIEGGVVTR